jgi:hypothetical protein
MVAHRLVEVHRVQHWRVVSGQQLVCDDEDLRLLVCLLELASHLLLSILRELEFVDIGPLDDVIRVVAVDDLGPLGRQQLVERPLVLRARLAVDGDEERLVAQWVDVLSKVVRRRTPPLASRGCLHRGTCADQRPAGAPC